MYLDHLPNGIYDRNENIGLHSEIPDQSAKIEHLPNLGMESDLHILQGQFRHTNATLCTGPMSFEASNLKP